jgi:glycerophosphoryl diester phosphodiesterase
MNTKCLPIAHRGAPLEQPENTIQSFARALEICPWCMFEMNVWMSSDGHVIISHDGFLESKTNGHGKNKFLYAE